jgi:sugar phosphate isomerase/epimerase
MELGLLIELRLIDKPLTRFATLATMGYSGLHVHFPEGCDKKLARTVASACAVNGLSLFAVSGYANPLRPDEAPMGVSLEGLRRMVELLPLLGARTLVSWSGTYSAELFSPHADNHGPAAWEALRRSVDDLLPALDRSEASLLLEPHAAHVLGDAARLAAFCAEVSSPYLGLVLDPANLLAQRAAGQDRAAIGALVEQLAPYTRLVHLRDLRLADGSPSSTGGATGSVNYPALLAALSRAGVSAPLVIEQVTLQQARAARAFVVAANGLP